MIVSEKVDRNGFLQASALPNPLLSTALARPEHPVLECEGLTWTGADLREAVVRAAARLVAWGVEPGHTVALAGPPSPEWVICFHAIGWVGAAVAPLPPRQTEEELAAALEVVAPDRVLLTHGLELEQRRRFRARAAQAAFLTELPGGPEPRERFWPLDEPRVVALTSGTTGRPRAVPLSTTQILLSAFGSAIRLGHEPGDRWLLCLPLHHVGGLSVLLRCAFYGTTVLLQERFDAARVARALDGGRVTQVSLVPRMLEQVLDARPARPFPASLRAILLGGDATPPSLIARCRELSLPVAITWGMTEAASQVSTRQPGDLSEDAGCGAPLPFVRVEPRQGALALRGPLAEGEVLTRDRGALDPRGRVHVTGREEEFLVSGGETLAVHELEAALASHPAIQEVGVVGAPDPRWGQRPVAFVVGEGERPDDEALRAFCRARLSGWKVPTSFVWLDALPRTAVGKLARAELARLAGATPGVSAPRPALEEERRAQGSLEVLDRLEEVSRSRGAEALGERLVELKAWVKDDLSELDVELAGVATRLDTEPQAARKAALHLLALPGKKLRPLCAALGARLGGRPLDGDVRRLAVAAELVHGATLLHDDIIDEGDERRGQPTARVVYGNTASVLGGDFLFAEALRLVTELGDTRLMERLVGVIAAMVDAEARQLERRGQLEADRAGYLRVIEGKTASLFAWVLWGGGRLGGLPGSLCDRLAEAGRALGLAFQLIDDALDLEGDPAVTGKDALADLRQGKLTWPFLLACERDPAVREELRALLALPDGEASPERLAALAERVRTLGCVEETRAFANEQAAAARAALEQLPESWVRAALLTVVDASVARSH